MKRKRNWKKNHKKNKKMRRRRMAYASYCKHEDLVNTCKNSIQNALSERKIKFY
jgi:hypothetical protein